MYINQRYCTLTVKDADRGCLNYRVNNTDNKSFWIHREYVFPTFKEMIEFHQTPNNSGVVILGDPILKSDIEKHLVMNVVQSSQNEWTCLDPVVTYAQKIFELP
ncbi:hypothetical protein RF11_02167 [Thelohanellus kitauei]|uniref:SH2 domain-containing protein n=1 Tax=Thelohanellus kitauei TaxID=669202 RepID=A0A0C2ILA4_THEKT|nr:hypothetical protein RF11_02167 [Thelohanellus kitauei]